MSFPTPNQPEKKSPGCGIGCLGVLGVIVVIAVIVGLVSWLSPKDNKPYDANNSVDVTSACEDQVKDQLKAPSSAKFSNEDATGDGTWTVTGSVDSQNSFGAMLRSDFQCTVIVDGDSIKTRVDQLG